MVMNLPPVGELAVDITAHRHRALHRLYVPLLYQNRSRLIAKRFHLHLRQQLALHRMLNLTVQIHKRRHRFQSLSLYRRSDPHHRDRRFHESKVVPKIKPRTDRSLRSVIETDLQSASKRI
ncbi:hypothetical protein FCV25MIE_06292 [Fagus crenata]